jgi:uncharacterized delta-60 repeat protein
MKMFRWLAAGVLVILLAALVLLRTGRVQPDQLPLSPAAASRSGGAAVPSVVPASTTSAISQTTARVDDSSPSSAFENWAREFVGANDARRAVLLPQAAALASARRAEMAELIRKNPELALKKALPFELRQKLPESVQQSIEQPVRGRGDYKVMGALPLEKATAGFEPVRREIEVAGKKYKAYTYGTRRQLRTRNGVSFHGVAVDNIMALAPEPVEIISASEALALKQQGVAEPDPICSVSGQDTKVLSDETWAVLGTDLIRFCNQAHASRFTFQMQQAESRLIGDTGGSASYPTNVPPGTEVNSTQGAKEVLFIRLRFPDDPTDPISESASYALMNSVNQFFVNSSYNTLTMNPTVTPLVTVTHPKEWYADVGGEFQLLIDGREAARLAGYDFRDYDLDALAFTTVRNFDFGGLAFVGARGVWLQSLTPGVAAHEFGHNLGLLHANFWRTGGAAGPPNPNAPGANFPIDPTSQVLRDDVNAPGDTSTQPDNPPGDVEYGDPFDTMGSAGAGIFQFSAHAKWQLGWLSERYVRTITRSETNRLYSFDAPLQSTGRLYALRVQKDFQRTYWLDHRSLWTANPWQSSGVELHWNDWVGTVGTSQLIDSTPGSPRGIEDSPVVVGRTFADPQSEMFITPIAKGGFGSEEYIDVVVHLGHNPLNQVPSVSLSASAANIAVGDAVTFTMTATDADGDGVAYYWDFGDDSFGPNTASVTHQFSTAGKYVVRCEVSDMKGGVGSAWVIVTVGTPNTYVITGQLIDDVGNPVPNHRVHNSGQGAAYRVGWSDSQGYYAIGNVPPGNYHIYPFQYGFRPLRFYDTPVQVTAQDVGALDAMQQQFPRVSITALTNADEGTLTPGQFEVSRTGSTDTDLTVAYVTSGTASAGINYEPLGLLTIPAGASSTILNVTPLDNGTADGPLTVTVTLRLTNSELRAVNVVTNITGTNVVVTRTNQVTFPGWELIPVNGQLTWFQTYPIKYVLGRPEATLKIEDNDVSAAPPSVGIFAFDDTALETGEDSAELVVIRQGSVENDLTIYYTIEPGVQFPASVEDYIPVSGQVTIPAGDSFAFVSLIARNDLFVEGNETLSVRITPNPAYSALISSAEVLLVDDDLPIVTVNASDAIASEPSANTGRFTFIRAGDFSGNLVVNYLVTGTATSGVDFQPLAGQVTIPAGQVSANVTVIPIEDAATENSETVNVFISESPLYNIGNPNSATVTIQDNELSTVTLAVTDGSAAEPNNTGIYTVTRTGPTNTPLVVNFLVGGTAIEQSDYGSIGTNVIIAAGSTTATIVINPIDENFREAEETIILQLQPGTNYNLGNAVTGTIALGDNDGSNKQAVGFVLRSMNVLESAGLVHVPVRSSIAPTDSRPTAIVEWHITGGSAVQDVDYTLSSTGYLAFATNGPPNPPVPVVTNLDIIVLNRPDVQSSRTLIVTLFDPQLIVTNFIRSNNVIIGSNVVAVATNAFLGAHRTFTLTIGDDDTNVVTVAASADLAYESGAIPGHFTITRAGSTNRALTVLYSLTGTASARTDYAALPNQVTIPAGTNAVRVVVAPVDDGTEESVETVQLRLISAVNGLIGSPDTATVRIVDNDGTIQFSLADYHVAESSSNAVLTVVRSGDTNLTTTIEYLFTGGTAVNGVDYFGTNGVLTFLPGETSHTINVPLVNDSFFEVEETVFLVLSNATGGVPLGGQNTTTLYIVNDDTTFSFASASFRGNENAPFASVDIRREGVLTNTDTVTFTATNGTAGAVDFTAVTFPVTFLPGVTNQTVLVPVQDDTLFEGDETANLILSEPTGATALGIISNATLVIVDDECQIEFEFAGYSIVEHSNFVSLVIRRVGGTVNPLSVVYTTSDGTATNGADYAPVSTLVNFTGDHYESNTNGSGELFFVPGETFRVVTVPILDDVLGEGNEFFDVTLTDPQALDPLALPGSVLLGTNASTIVTILDNELPGFVDYEFNPGAGANATVRAVAQTPRGGLVEFLGRVVIGGDFTAVNNIALGHVARLLPNGTPDPGFNPGAGADGNVLAVAVQPDGRVLVGGEFITMNNTNRPRLARLNADGNLDLSFDTGIDGVDGNVRAIVVQPDGRVVIGGEFNQVNGVARNFIARLQTNGALDTNFAANVNGNIHALALQEDGKILIGGAFTTVGGLSRLSLARLNVNGSLDTNFVVGTGFNGPVHGVAALEGGKVLAGGAFSNYNAAAARNLVRLETSGLLDNSFKSGTGPDATVFSVASSLGGRMVIGGAFLTYNALPRAGFARLTPNGGVDRIFDIGTGANGTVRSIIAQDNTAVVIGGDFTEVNGLPRNRVARVHGDEFLDLVGVEFSASQYSVSEAGGAVIRITVQRTGSTNRAFSVDYLTADGTATSPADYQGVAGTLSFASGQTAASFDIEVFDDLLVEGNETVRLTLTNTTALVELGEQSRATLVILDSARSVYFSDPEYSVNEGGTNAAIALTRAGSLVGDVTVTLSTSNLTAAAGYDYVGFTNLITFTNGESLKTVLLPFISDDGIPEFTEALALTLTAGSVGVSGPPTVTLHIFDNDPGPGFPDQRFDPGVGASRFVRALALQTDGKLVVGGAFTNFGGFGQNFLTRLQTNGLVDTNFTTGTGPNALVSGIGLSSDGHIAIGGAFSNYNGQAFNRVVRLTTNGLPDPFFTQPLSFDSAINGLVSQADGKILVGGAFKVPASGVARIRVNGTLDLQFDPSTGADGPVNAVALQSDGKVLIGGGFTNVAGFPRPRLARLGTNGILDVTLPAITITNGNIFALAPAPGGKIVIGGSFRYVNGFPRSGIARLNGDGSLDLTFNPGTGVTGTVYTVSVITNGSVFMGGDFTSVDGVSCRRYALLRENGSVETQFDASVGADNTVFASVITPDQQVIIGGDFTTVGGQQRRGVARLNMVNDQLLRFTQVVSEGGSVLLRLNSIPGNAYILEGSTNFSQWFSIKTNAVSGTTWDFYDPIAPANSQRFYRARRFGP